MLSFPGERATGADEAPGITASRDAALLAQSRPRSRPSGVLLASDIDPGAEDGQDRPP